MPHRENKQMDELLFERVTQLEEIDESLERILKTPNGNCDATTWAIGRLRLDIALMIRNAKEEYAAF